MKIELKQHIPYENANIALALPLCSENVLQKQQSEKRLIGVK